MRILFVTDHYPPFVGGAERQTHLLATHFAASGHDVAVAAPWVKGLPDVDTEEGVTVYRVRQVRNIWGSRAAGERIHHAPPYPDPVMAWRLRRLIRRFDPDIVHSHGWIGFSAAVALLGVRTTFLVSARDYGYFCATRTLLRHDNEPCSGPGLRKCLPCAGSLYGRPKGAIAVAGVFAFRPLLRRKVSAVISDSTFVSRMMGKHFLFDPTGSTSTLNAVIPSFLHEDADDDRGEWRTLLDSLPAEPFILYVGQFRRVKGLDVLLEAYERLDAPPPLVLIGNPHRDGPQEFPPHATVLTAWPHRAVMAAYERALFAVMPSRLPEPLGIVVHEAMSRGKPVIGSNHGGHTDMIVNGETGFLVPPGDVSALVAAMERLRGDPELRARMGEAARERSRMFHAASSLPRFARLYEDLAGAVRRAG